MSEHLTIERVVDQFGDSGWWIACEHPERPPDPYTAWDWSCDRCILHLTVAARTAAEDSTYRTTSIEKGTVTYRTLAATLAEAVAYRHSLR